MSGGILVSGLNVGYGGRRVLWDVSFAHTDGVLCVLGPNGVGKSTLFRCLLGLNRRYEGEILMEDNNIRALNEPRMAKLCAFVPQSQAAVFGYTVLEMVLMGAGAQTAPRPPGRAQREAALESMNRVGIAALAGRDYSRISGGERQLALIARALAQAGRILIMDEPTANLDYGNQLRVLSEIRRLADEGLCVVLSTHHPDQAFQCADAVLALSEGRVAALGAPDEVVDARLIERLYGVKVRMERTPSGHRVAVAGV